MLLRQPDIFILDEATASVDPFTECQIREALDLILSQTTGLLIAHRLSTVKSADRIVVLDHGNIVEEGSHAPEPGLRGADGEVGVACGISEASRAACAMICWPARSYNIASYGVMTSGVEYSGCA